MPRRIFYREPDGPSPRFARYEVQLMLAQMQGLMWLAAAEAKEWLPDTAIEDLEDLEEPELTGTDLQRAALEGHERCAHVQSELNSGKYDQKLLAAGFGGAQGEVKQRGWRAALNRLYKSGQRTARDFLPALQWGRMVVGSVASAVPGAEAIGELLEVLMHAGESGEEGRVARPPRGKAQ